MFNPQLYLLACAEIVASLRCDAAQPPSKPPDDELLPIARAAGILQVAPYCSGDCSHAMGNLSHRGLRGGDRAWQPALVRA